MTGHDITDSLATQEVTLEQAILFSEGMLRLALENIPNEILAMPMHELEELSPPREIDYLLQRNFWKAVNNAARQENPKIILSHIYNGVCSKQNFQKIMNSPHRLAWIVNFPKKDMERMEGMLSAGLGKIEREILTMKINDKNAGHFLKLIEMLMNRVHGPLIQRIESKHAHYKVPPAANPDTVKDVNQRLEELKSKLIAAPKNTDIITQVKENQQEYDTIEVTHESNSG